MSEIFVYGDSEFILGFELVGIKNSMERIIGEEKKQIASITDNSDVGILVIDEKITKKFTDDFNNDLNNLIKPVVVVMSKNTAGDSDLRKMIIKSIGVDLYKD